MRAVTIWTGLCEAEHEGEATTPRERKSWDNRLKAKEDRQEDAGRKQGEGRHKRRCKGREHRERDAVDRIVRGGS